MNSKVLVKMNSTKVVLAALVFFLLVGLTAVPRAAAQVVTNDIRGYDVTIKITGVYCQDNEEGFSGSDEIFLETTVWDNYKYDVVRSWTYDMDRGDMLYAGHFQTITLRDIPLNSDYHMQIELIEDDSGFWDGDDSLGIAPGYLTAADLKYYASTGQYLVSSHWLTGSNNGDSYAYRVDFEVYITPIYNIARIG